MEIQLLKVRWNIHRTKRKEEAGTLGTLEPDAVEPRVSVTDGKYFIYSGGVRRLEVGDRQKAFVNVRYPCQERKTEWLASIRWPSRWECLRMSLEPV